MGRAGRFWQGLGGTLAAVAVTSCGCNQPTCVSAEESNVRLELDVDQLAEMSLEACRNQDCFTASFESLVGTMLGSSPTHLHTEPPSFRHDASVKSDDGHILLNVTWHPNDPRRGDRITLTLKTPDGDAWYTGEGEVTDLHTYHADNCDNTTCHSATVALPSP